MQSNHQISKDLEDRSSDRNAALPEAMMDDVAALSREDVAQWTSKEKERNMQVCEAVVMPDWRQDCTDG